MLRPSLRPGPSLKLQPTDRVQAVRHAQVVALIQITSSTAAGGPLWHVAVRHHHRGHSRDEGRRKATESKQSHPSAKRLGPLQRLNPYTYPQQEPKASKVRPERAKSKGVPLRKTSKNVPNAQDRAQNVQRCCGDLWATVAVVLAREHLDSRFYGFITPRCITMRLRVRIPVSLSIMNAALMEYTACSGCCT